MGQVAAADLHRREPLDVGRPVPRQQRGRAIHARVAQPRLGRADQPARRQRAMIAGEEADGVRRLIAAADGWLARCAPGQPQGLGGNSPGAGW